jgi:23S rRNA (adenine1618-N6)-methyltransferase
LQILTAFPFVVTADVTWVALEWAQKNVQNNPHLVDLIEIRKAREGEVEEKNGCTQKNEEDGPLESLSFDESEQGVVEDGSQLSTSGQPEETCKEESGAVNLLLTFNDHQIEESLEVPLSKGSGVVSKNCEGPPVLLGVMREGEQFDFCMCNPPFFESMEEAGANPRTACGGTMEEMVCPGGEQAFIQHIINDSVHLKEQIRLAFYLCFFITCHFSFVLLLSLNIIVC